MRAGFAPVSCPEGLRMGLNAGQSEVGLELSTRNDKMKIISLPYSSAPRNSENVISGQFCGFKGPERTHRSPASLESRRPRNTWPERRCSPDMPESREGREQLLETRVERLDGRVPPSLSMTITRTSLSRGPPSSIESSFRDHSTYITHSTATAAANQAKTGDVEQARWAYRTTMS
jgi:hypothetical protein